MLPPITRPAGACRLVLVLAALAVWIAAPNRGAAQGPVPASSCPIGPNCAPILPNVPQKAPRPLQGADSVTSFIDSLSVNDAGFEVIVGQGRILTFKADLAPPGKVAAVAMGDPSIIDVQVVTPRQLRILGQRMGVTDLSITDVNGRNFNLEIRVVADLEVLRGQLRCVFPDAQLKLCQLRDHVVVEGQARDVAQVQHILETIRAYLLSVVTGQLRSISGTTGAGGGQPGGAPRPGVPPNGAQPSGQGPGGITPAGGGGSNIQGSILVPRIINLIRVPTSQQVLLKVRVAELNRTALRQIGSDFLAVDHDTGAIVGTALSNAAISGTGTISGRMVTGLATGASTATTSAFGIFEKGGFEIFLNALRRNSMLRILAEPNLVAMNGHQASFLAGGQFPVPVSTFSGTGGAASVSVQFQNFGVQLGFVPTILDNETIRLTVDPEVSDVDFALATTLVPGGSPVPGLSTRRAHTTVEMHPGQTLAIAGLLQLELSGQTARIPGLGDLPIIGPFFSNTSHQRIEKELIVLVTPYIVEPLNCDQVPPSPGDEVLTPNDLEFYFLNRIEGRTGRDFRSTTEYDDALHVLRCLLRLEHDYVRGPHGFCDCGR